MNCHRRRNARAPDSQKLHRIDRKISPSAPRGGRYSSNARFKDGYTMTNAGAGPLIIGANGYVGRHVCQAYAEAGLSFTMTTRSEGLDLQHAFPNQPIIRRFSLDDPSSYEMVSDFRSIVILASASVPSTFADSVRGEAMHNLLPFIDFVDRLPAGTRVVYASSGGTVYGDTTFDGVIGEDTPLCPISPYGLMKGMIEQLIRYHAHRRGINFVIVRPSNPVGPALSAAVGDTRRRPQGAVTIFLRKILAGDPITMFGDGQNERDYFDVRDLGRGIVAVEQDRSVRNVTLNMGMGRGTTLNALIAMIAEAAGLPVTIDRQPERGFDVKRIVLDTQRIRTLTGWTAQIPLEQSIRDTRDWLAS
jgi:UDP-glucose 4-epimerase